MCAKQKSLIIGAAGFVGSYLIEQLESNCSISVTKLPHETVSGNTENVEVYNLDIMNINNIKDLLKVGGYMFEKIFCIINLWALDKFSIYHNMHILI